MFDIAVCFHCSVCFLSGCLPLAFHFAFHSLSVTTLHCLTVVLLLNPLTSEAFDICSWIMSLYVCHVKAAMMCCKELLKRMEPAKKGLKDPTWQGWTMAAYQQSIDLCATYMWVAIAWFDLCMWNFSQAGTELWRCDVSLQLIVPHFSQAGTKLWQLCKSEVIHVYQYRLS